MSKLLIGTTQKFDLSGRLQFGNIPVNFLYERFKDGRLIGLLIEDLIESEVSGITRVKNNTSAFDLIKTDCKVPLRIQCKSYNKNNINLSPSYMIGAGRRYNKEGFYQYIDSIDIFSLVDTRSFPFIRIDNLYTSDILKLIDPDKNAIVSCKKLYAFLNKT